MGIEQATLDHRSFSGVDSERERALVLGGCLLIASQRAQDDRIQSPRKIGHALAQGQRHPESIEPCAKESKPVGAVATELRLEVVAQAL